jgi:hypothetical protein
MPLEKMGEHPLRFHPPEFPSAHESRTAVLCFFADQGPGP